MLEVGLKSGEDSSSNIKLCRARTQDNKGSPNDQSSEEDSYSADDDLKDTAEDSDSESGTSSDNPGEWALSYRPHFSSHGNQPLRAPLVDTETTSLQDRGEENRRGQRKDLCIFVLITDSTYL